jgi:hypothetical protein
MWLNCCCRQEREQVPSGRLRSDSMKRSTKLAWLAWEGDETGHNADFQ